jgi:amino acid permease
LPSLIQTFTGDSQSVYVSRDYILMYTCCLFLPFSFFKHIAHLAFLSFLSVMALVVMVALVTLKAAIVQPPLPSLASAGFFGPSVGSFYSALGGLR